MGKNRAPALAADKRGGNAGACQQMDTQTQCGPVTQPNGAQPCKGRECCHVLPHGHADEPEDITPNPKTQTLYVGSTCMRSLQKPNPQRRTEGRWLPGLGEGHGDLRFNGHRVSVSQADHTVTAVWHRERVNTTSGARQMVTMANLVLYFITIFF